MKIFLVAFAVFLIAVVGMAAGVIFGYRRLRGTCGGLAGLRDEHGDAMCEACSTPSESCSRFSNRVSDTGVDTAANAEPSDSSESVVKNAAR